MLQKKHTDNIQSNVTCFLLFGVLLCFPWSECVLLRVIKFQLEVQALGKIHMTFALLQHQMHLGSTNLAIYQ